MGALSYRLGMMVGDGGEGVAILFGGTDTRSGGAGAGPRRCRASAARLGLAGAERTLRRRVDGGVTIAVVLRGRPFVAVVGDMIEGIVVANQLDGTAATRARTALWEAVVADDEAAA